MKKSMIFFNMLSAAITFIACEQNSNIGGTTPLEVDKTSAIKKQNLLSLHSKRTLLRTKSNGVFIPAAMSG